MSSVGELQILPLTADTTLIKDQKVKTPLYTLAGVREYWLVDVLACEITVYSEPSNGVYEVQNTYSLGKYFSHSLHQEVNVDLFFPWN